MLTTIALVALSAIAPRQVRMPPASRRPDPLADIELIPRSRYPIILLGTAGGDRARADGIDQRRAWAGTRTVSAP